MRRCSQLVLLLAIVLASLPLHAQSKAKAENVPEIPYDSVPNFLKLPPNLYLGEGIGVATNSKGHVFVYTRSGDTRLFEFDRTGAFVREIGQGLYGFEFAHAVRVDADDNIWAVDEGTNMVIKFNPEGRVVMVLGRRPEAVEGLVAPAPGAPAPPPEPYVFSRPTDVGWDTAGNIFVTDGYGNSRVVKFDRNGRFVKEAGTRGSQRGQLNLPHTMAMDADGNVYVGDRSNARVQVFDNDLNVKAIYDNVGNPWAVCISPRAPSIFVRVELSSRQRARAIQGHHRRDLQDGAGRHDRRQVRQSRQAAEGIQHGARDRLPEPQRAVRRRKSLRGGCRRSFWARSHATAQRQEAGHDTPRPARCMMTVASSRDRYAQSPVPDIPFDAVAEPIADAARYPSRRGRWRSDRLQRANLRLHANRQSDRRPRKLAPVHARRIAPLPVRCARQLPQEIGQGIYGFLVAHSVRVDAQDNIWIVDEGSSQVIEFAPDGHVLMILGRKPEAVSVRVPTASGQAPSTGAGQGRGGAAPGAGGDGDQFTRPSDVAWDGDGNIFVADGHGPNARIAKFDRNGRFLLSWGSRGSDAGQFDTPHSLATDAQGNVYVADQGNKRIQVFDGSGHVKSQITNVGVPTALCISRGSHPYLYSSHTGDAYGMDDAADVQARARRANRR